MKAFIIVLAAVLATVVATIAVHCIVYAILSSAPQETDYRVNKTVKAVCDYSRSIISGEAEEACGIAQDQSNTEYICSSYAVDAVCWIEDKRGEL